MDPAFNVSCGKCLSVRRESDSAYLSSFESPYASVRAQIPQEERTAICYCHSLAIRRKGDGPIQAFITRHLKLAQLFASRRVPNVNNRTVVDRRQQLAVRGQTDFIDSSTMSK